MFDGDPRDYERRPERPKYSKGYTDIRDPAVEKPSGVLSPDLSEAGLRRSRERTAPRLTL